MMFKFQSKLLKSTEVALAFSLVLVAASLSGCWSKSEHEVVVYAALDAEFSEPIFREYAQATGVQVLPKFDVESTKTVGLATAILAERERPRADVFWNNEILHTLRLEQHGLLEAYASPAGRAFPEAFRAADGAWYGFAARARVLVVNTKLVPEAERPKSIYDLTDPKWRGKVAMAKPLFGTTATHAACLFAALGDDKAKAFFHKLKANDVQIVSGNKQVATAVASGRLAFGITDTDDAMIEIEHGWPVAIVFPDSQPGQLGTLFIPNTLAIIKGCPHPAEARRLIDYLLRPEIEAKLATGPSAQIPLNPSVKTPSRIATPQTIHAMRVDWREAARKWEDVTKFLRDEFATGE
jgi:iron(III) transport system substrate-binding protein